MHGYNMLSCLPRSSVFFFALQKIQVPSSSSTPTKQASTTHGRAHVTNDDAISLLGVSTTSIQESGLKMIERTAFEWKRCIPALQSHLSEQLPQHCKASGEPTSHGWKRAVCNPHTPRVCHATKSEQWLNEGICLHDSNPSVVRISVHNVQNSRIDHAWMHGIGGH